MVLFNQEVFMTAEVISSHIVRIIDDDGTEIIVRAAANGGLQCIGKLIQKSRIRIIPKPQFARMMSRAGQEFARLRHQQQRVG